MSKPPRHVLITGATKGIGRALVDQLVALGCVVSGCGRSPGLVDELSDRHGDPHRFAAVDVADAAAVDAWAATLLDEGRVPDLVLNNAALMNELKPLWECSAEEFAAMLAVNIGGVQNVVRAFVPAMIQRGSGVVVNLSSGWGRSSSPDVGPYCTTKHAIEGYSGSLAQELPRGLACIALSPGVVDTEMLRKCLPDTARATDGPGTWAERHAKALLEFGPADNGQSLSLG